MDANGDTVCPIPFYNYQRLLAFISGLNLLPWLRARRRFNMSHLLRTLHLRSMALHQKLRQPLHATLAVDARQCALAFG
jgi:hypothetical protein